MSFTVQVGPVLAARLNSMSCSYWSSQASSRKGLSCTRAPRRRSWSLLLILRVGAWIVFSFTSDESPTPEQFCASITTATAACTQRGTQPFHWPCTFVADYL